MRKTCRVQFICSVMWIEGFLPMFRHFVVDWSHDVEAIAVRADGSMLINPTWWATLSDEEQAGVMRHEARHVAVLAQLSDSHNPSSSFGGDGR